jgi:predicted permease
MSLWSRVRRTANGRRHTDDIREELQFHLDMDVASGRDPRQAQIRLGSRSRIEEDMRAVGIVTWLESCTQDLRYGWRQMHRAPVVTLAVLLSLTIGIGATTAIFSLLDAAILKPLPVPNAQELRILEWTNDGYPHGVENINGDSSMTAGRFRASSVGADVYRRLARQQTAFDALVGFADSVPTALALDSSPAEQVSLQYVSANFFQGLEVAVLGRPFRDDDDRVGVEPVVIVSNRYWVGRLGGDTSAIGRAIRINNVPTRIVGVAPPGFFGVRPGQWSDVYAPLAARVAFRPTQRATGALGENDRDWWIRQIGRLKSGLTDEAARAALDPIFRGLASETTGLVEEKKIPTLVIAPGARGLAALTPRDTSALWILMGLVTVLLFIVCTNVANLLLSRAVARQRESAVRLALGAGRFRLLRQHAIEIGMIACVGGASGLALGDVLARGIHALFETGRDASYAFDLHLSARVLWFTAGSATLTALLFGLAPAVRTARTDLQDVLKAQARGIVGSRLRVPKLLASLQVGLCLAAVIAAALLARSLQTLERLDVGFERDNLAYVSVNPWQAGYTAERMPAYLDRARDELARIPGVVQVAPLEVRLLSGSGNAAGVVVPGRVSRPSDHANFNHVGEHAFDTMGIPLLAGRAFEPADRQPDSHAVIVDERFARLFFPDRSPLGGRFGFNQKDPERYEIVGVVGDTFYNNLRNAPQAMVFLPYYWSSTADIFSASTGPVNFAVRARVDDGRLAQAARAALASVDPAVPMSDFQTQTHLIDRILRTERLLGFISGAFGLLALTLVGIGLGGLLTYAVARRTNEIGIRMALGATRSVVIREVLTEALVMVAVGVALGLPMAYVMATALRSQLFEIQPVDPLAIAGGLAGLMLTAVAATLIPARRAAAVDPLVALRAE